MYYFQLPLAFSNLPGYELKCLRACTVSFSTQWELYVQVTEYPAIWQAEFWKRLFRRRKTYTRVYIGQHEWRDLENMKRVNLNLETALIRLLWNVQQEFEVSQIRDSWVASEGADATLYKALEYSHED